MCPVCDQKGLPMVKPNQSNKQKTQSGHTESSGGSTCDLWGQNSIRDPRISSSIRAEHEPDQTDRKIHPERSPREVRVFAGACFFLVNYLLPMVILVWGQWYAGKCVINRTVLQEGKAMPISMVGIVQPRLISGWPMWCHWTWGWEHVQFLWASMSQLQHTVSGGLIFFLIYESEGGGWARG